MIIITHEIIELVKDNHAWIVLTKSLAMRASFDEYQKSFPSIEKICEDANLSKPTVIKALQYLKEIGIIQIKKVQKQGFIQRNEYFILTDKIKTIGKMKINAPVKEIDPRQSTTFTSASKGDLPEPVKEVYSNHKPNLTSSPNNELPQPQNILEIKNHPIYEKQKHLCFPDLTDEEINLHVETYLLDYPKSKPTSIFNFLKEKNSVKKKDAKITERIEGKKENPTYTGVLVKVTQSKDETREEFDLRVDEREEMTGSQYERIYSVEENNEVKSMIKNLKMNFKKL